jgi:hypothetical protein
MMCGVFKGLPLNEKGLELKAEKYHKPNAIKEMS